MAQPTSSDVHVNIPLTQISVAFIQDAKNFIADQVFPILPVERQSDSYLTYDRSYWFRDTAVERAPGTESAGDGYSVDFNNQYFARVYAIHKDIDDQTRGNALPPVDLDRDTTEWLTQKLLIRKELQWAGSFFGPGIWSGNMTGVTASPTPGTQFLQWNISGSTPIEDIMGRIIAVTALTGIKPNVLVLTPDVYNVLVNHAEIIERIKYSQLGVTTEQLMAEIFGIDKLLVAWAVTNSAEEQAPATVPQVGNYNFAMSNGALLLYAAPGPSLMRPSAGYTFAWTGYTGAGAAGNRILQFRMEWLKSDRIEGEIAFAQQVIAPDLGVFFANCI
jgi:hypothetical protein